MNLLLFFPGLLIMLLTIFDLIYTIFAPRGSGFISGQITSLVSFFFRVLYRIRKSKNVYNSQGVVIVVSIVLVWVMLLWLSNMMVVMSDPEAVINSSSYLPATPLERFYYTGYLLTTLGVGDFIGGTDLWKIYAAFVSFTGLLVITLSITYMVPVLSAVTERRSLSIRIAAIGHSPQAMLVNNWNGQDFSMLNAQLQELAQSIAKQGQLHFSYPVLHFFHQSRKETALLPNLVAFDEALSLLLLYVPKELRPGEQYIFPVRCAISSFLETLTATFIKPAETEPPAFRLDSIRKLHFTLHMPSQDRIGELALRRRILKSMMENGGWHWEDLDGPVFNTKLDLSPTD
ncbi:two pore domain potassium channel family protein [Pontibacter sp. 172403-2]|uniref:potassium channel family protein n=1 Tax=Pontibacter rufus TaxID=2791028 RepID=UPI0018AF787E|nr:potassium channel family protein [Pontibacter sp. 172403-2]MBF9253575.1 two pore domain potassium channel family protein [Pontibacter sp. 172403-2]